MPTRKVGSATLGSAAGYFLADVAAQAWPAFPDSGELFFVVLFTFAAGYLVKERDAPNYEGT